MVAVPRSATFNLVFGGATTATINKPSGATTGDLCIIGLYGWSGFYQAADSDNRLYVTGFTTHAETITGSTPAIGLYRRVIDGSEGATFTCGFDSGSNQMMFCVLIEAGTYDPTTPLDTYAMAADAGTTSAVDAPTMTVGAGGDKLSIGFWGADASAPWTAPGGWTELLDTTGSGFGTGLVAYRTPSAGATGTQTATAGSGVAGSGQAAGFQISINAAPPVAPDAPVALTVNAGYATSTLVAWWDPPANNGGATITDYVIQHRTSSGPGSWTTFSDGASSAAGTAITGLTDGVAYDVQVAATNSVGTGSYSSTVGPSTPAAPVVPSGITIAPHPPSGPPAYQT